MDRTRLEAAAGGAGGSWYVLLEGLARLIGEIEPTIEIVVVEGGGVQNHSAVGSGRLPLAILNPPMTRAAIAGRPPYDQPYSDLRVGVTNLTVNHLQFMADRALPIASLEACAQQRFPLRIPVDRVGTVDRLVFELALEQAGLSLDDLAAWGGGGVPADNYNQQLELYRSGQVDALWQFMGIPSPSIEAAHAARPLRALPMPLGFSDRLAPLGWEPARLPVGTYGLPDAAVPTVAMGTSLGFHATVSADVVAAIVAALCDNPDQVRAIHPAAASFDPARASQNPGGPLHAGAKRYFQARGRLTLS